MVKDIVRDILFLKQKSTPATKEDMQIIIDLKDTLAAKKEECVGMAANMIGYSKNIIIVTTAIIGPVAVNVVMVNPKIISKTGKYETEEGCLSLDGVRKTTRYQTIEVEYEDENFKKKKQRYTGFVAQIIQHEMDHLDGIII